MQLFRQQALDHQNRLHGEVFLVPPLRWQAIGWLLMLATIAAGLLLAFGSYSRTIQVTGVIQPAQQRALTMASPGDVMPKAPDKSSATPADASDSGASQPSTVGVLPTTTSASKAGVSDERAAETGMLAELRAPLSSAGKIVIGQPVSVTIRGYPPETFGALGGSVVAIGTAPVDADEPYLPVVVRLAPPTDQQSANGLRLRSHLRVDGTVTVGSISLLQWLFEPVLPAAIIAS